MKYLLGVIAVLLLICVGLGWAVSDKNDDIERLQGVITDQADRLKRSEEGRAKDNQSCTLTDTTVSVSVEKTEELEKKSKELVDKLDDRLKKVDDAKVPTQNLIVDPRDTIMLDSMWYAYCTAKPDEASCSKRRAVD